MNKITLLFTLVILLPAIAHAEEGLIGHWKFDGNGNNEIVNGTNAALVGNAVFNSDGGKLGGYLYIPANGDYAKIPYNSTFDLPTSWTIEFWFRQRSNQSFLQSLVYKGTPVNNYNFYIYRQLWNEYNYGPIIVGYTAVNTGYWSQTSNPNQLSHGEWHHVAYTRDSNGAAYYLDGVLTHYLNLTQYTEYSGSAKTPATDIIIGDSAVDTDIDNLRIYNRALSIDEVRSNGDFPTTCPTCSAPTEWSTCGSGYQYRTNYKCDSSTSYQCWSQGESQSCIVPVNNTTSNQTTINDTTNQTTIEATTINDTTNQTTIEDTTNQTAIVYETANQTSITEATTNQTDSVNETAVVQEEPIPEAPETSDDTTSEVQIAPVVIEQAEEPIECNGCTYQSSCLPYGTRLTQNNKTVYCDISKVLEEQKEDDQSCQNNYECVNNYCIDSICKNLQKELEKERNAVQTLIDFINKIFNFFGKWLGKKTI